MMHPSDRPRSGMIGIRFLGTDATRQLRRSWPMLGIKSGVLGGGGKGEGVHNDEMIRMFSIDGQWNAGVSCWLPGHLGFLLYRNSPDRSESAAIVHVAINWDLRWVHACGSLGVLAPPVAAGVGDGRIETSVTHKEGTKTGTTADCVC